MIENIIENIVFWTKRFAKIRKSIYPTGSWICRRTSQPPWKRASTYLILQRSWGWQRYWTTRSDPYQDHHPQRCHVSDHWVCAMLLSRRGSKCLVQRQLEFNSARRMKQNTIQLSVWRCSAQLRQAVLHHIKLSWFVHREQQLFATVDL